MKIRPFHPGDIEALARIYQEAARQFGPQGYGEEQVRMWAAYPDDLEAFRTTLSQGITLCAIEDGSPEAFGQLHPVDHLQFLYTHPDFAGRGFARAILHELEQHALRKCVQAISLDSSVVARTFYERHGYQIEATERVTRSGVEFLRYRMRKSLT